MRLGRTTVSTAAILLLLTSCSAKGADPTPPSPTASHSAKPATEAESNAPTPAPRRLAILAHRGSTTRKISENGLPALMRASRLGADMVEFDVRPTLDRELVIMHDGGLVRTTDCSGQVWSRTLSYIRAHCVLEDGSWVPSFTEYVDLARRQRMPLMIELKAGPGWSSQVFAQMSGLLETADSPRGSVFLSFDEHLLELAHESMPQIPGIWIVSRQMSVSKPRSRRALGMDVGGFLVDGELTSRSWVRHAHREEKLVYGRVVDTREGWERCRDIGLDGVLSNDLAGFLEWRASVTG